MAYATVDDLAGYVTTVPATATVLLDRCSRDINAALLTAVYDPTDADVQRVLREATCEQAAGYIDNGNPTGGSRSAVSSFSIGSVSVTKGGGQQGPPSPPAMVGDLYRQAWQVLAEAGLTGQPPWSC